MTRAELWGALPTLVLCAGALAVLLLCRLIRRRAAVETLSILFLVAAAALAVLLPGLPSSVGGMFTPRGLGRLFAVFFSLLGANTILAATRYGRERNLSAGEHGALVLFACAGMIWLASAASIWGLVIGLSSFTVSLYILIAFARDGGAGSEAAIKYLTMGMIAGGILAFGLALLYVAGGTLDLTRQKEALAGDAIRPLTLMSLALVLAALGFKISLAPFHLWTPDVYQGAPAPAAGLLSGGSKAAALAGLLLLLPAGAPLPQARTMLLLLSALSLVWGTLAALRQTDLKRLLAYSSVVQMGTAAIGVIAGNRSGAAAVVFYLVFYGLAAAGSFAFLAALANTADEPEHLEDLRGLGFRRPLPALGLAVCMLAFAGIPPTGGFFAKLQVFAAAVLAGQWEIALAGVLAAFVSVAYYLRVIMLLYMSDETAPDRPRPRAAETLAVLIPALLLLLLGILPGGLMTWIHLGL